MPPGGAASEDAWNTAHRAKYNQLACCAGVRTPTSDCTGVTCEWSNGRLVTGSEVSKPDFFTGWMKKKGFEPEEFPTFMTSIGSGLANGKQFIKGPDVATATPKLVKCPSGLNPPLDPAIPGPKDMCLELTWQDTGNPWTAAPAWYYTKQTRQLIEPTFTLKAQQDTEFCPGTLQTVPPPKVPLHGFTQLREDANGDRWRFEYKTYYVVPWCRDHGPILRRLVWTKHEPEQKF